MPTMAAMVMRGGSGELGVSEGEELGWAFEVGVLDLLSELDVLLDVLMGVSVDDEVGDCEVVVADVG
jgi:hypothetical protein